MYQFQVNGCGDCCVVVVVVVVVVFIVIVHMSFTCVHLQGAKDEQQTSISKLKRRFLKDRQSSSAFYARLQVKKKQNREVCSVTVSSRVCTV